MRPILYQGTITQYKNFNDELKRSIRERDSFTCQVCRTSMKTLVVHHINYRKEDCHPYNLITLCFDCHKKTNNHRYDWITLFSEKFTKRFKDYNTYVRKQAYINKYHKSPVTHFKNGEVILKKT